MPNAGVEWSSASRFAETSRITALRSTFLFLAPALWERNCPLGGGEANNWPTTEKRNVANTFPGPVKHR